MRATTMFDSSQAQRLASEGGVLNRPMRQKLGDLALVTGKDQRAVRVVDVHHADQCYGGETATHLFCHPDAKRGFWHWVVKPATP